MQDTGSEKLIWVSRCLNSCARGNAARELLLSRQLLACSVADVFQLAALIVQINMTTPHSEADDSITRVE